jgi:hypothetical protein
MGLDAWWGFSLKQQEILQMDDKEARERALETIKPFEFDIVAPDFSDMDGLITAIANAIKSAYDDGWDRGTR